MMPLGTNLDAQLITGIKSIMPLVIALATPSMVLAAPAAPEQADDAGAHRHNHPGLAGRSSRWANGQTEDQSWLDRRWPVISAAGGILFYLLQLHSTEMVKLIKR